MGKPKLPEVAAFQYKTRMNVKQIPFQKWGSLINSVVCILFLILTITAMFFYPGGNREDNMEPGFNLLYVTLSDLGRYYAINSLPNTISQALFVPGFILLGISNVIFYLILDSFYKETEKIKWASLTGTILGVISGIFYIFIALTPVDLQVKLHNAFIFAAAPFKYGALICFVIVMFVDKKLPKKFSYLILSILILYFFLATAVTVGSLLM